MTDDNAPVRFDTKIAVLLRDDLETWQRLNVTAFLVSGLGTEVPELIGEPYADADDTPYLPMFRQPVLVFTGSKELLSTAHGRAVGRGATLAVFTSDLFATGHDKANRAAVRAVPRDSMDLVGLAVHGRGTAWTRSSRVRRCTPDPGSRRHRTDTHGHTRASDGARCHTQDKSA